MKHRNRMTIVALAAVAGLVATGILHRATVVLPGDVPTEPMVVAAVNLGERHAPAPDELKIVMVKERPQGSFSSIEELKDRLPIVAVPAGQPVLSSHLAAAGAEAGLWNRVPPGKRAITVGINEIAGVAGFLKPDLHVDIIGVSQDGQDWRTAIVAQNIPILAVAQEDKAKGGDESAPKVATSATLLVTPEQAKAISLAAERGRIRLALRSNDDHVIVKSAPEPKPRMAARAQAPRHSNPAPRAIAQPQPRQVAAPAAPTPPLKPGIEVISGENMEVVRP